MLILFGVLQAELNIPADVIVALVNGEFESFALLVPVLEDLLFLFLVENDIDVDSASEPSEKAGDFILN